MMTKGKKPGLDKIAPPPRRASGNLAQQPKGSKVQFNTRIEHDLAIYARVLAARTGRPLNDVVEEALTLLRDKHGAV